MSSRETERTTRADSTRTAACAVLVCLALAACAGREEGAGTRADTPAAPGQTTGTLRGVVRLTGTLIPDQPVIENSTDPEVCGATQRVDDLLVDGASRGIANVVVSLRDAPSAEKLPPEPSRLVLDNRDCQFVPRVAVLTVGDTIQAVSHDDVLHTVHLYGALERNIALPDPSAAMDVTVDEPGMITVLCDVHGWMKAYVRVDAHRLHAVSDEQGRFVIGDVPAGSWELDVWHERLGSQTLTVRVAPDADQELEIAYSRDERAATVPDAAASREHLQDDPSTRSHE